jgi:hypothetical protein
LATGALTTLLEDAAALTGLAIVMQGLAMSRSAAMSGEGIVPAGAVRIRRELAAT